jgi:hypothetical protein
VTGPDGTTLYYLQDDDSIADFGELQKVGTFKDIAPLSNAEGDVINAANALYDAAAEYLLRHGVPQRSYRLNVKNVQQRIQAGDKIHIRYHGRVYQNGAPLDIVDEDGDFWVMRVTEQVSADSSNVTLEVAHVDRYEESVAEVVVGAIESIRLRNLKPATTTAPRSYVYAREVAPGFPAVVPVEITEATLKVHRVRVRLKTSPFRATASVAAAGGDHRHLVFPFRESYQFNFPDAIISQRYDVATDKDGTPAPVGSPFNPLFGPVEDIWTWEGSGDHTHDIEYGIEDDTATPQGVQVWVNGINRTSALGGPFAPSGGNINVILDEGLITQWLHEATGGIQREHTVEFRCSGGQGRIECTVEVYETAQSIKVF